MSDKVIIKYMKNIKKIFRYKNVRILHWFNELEKLKNKLKTDPLNPELHINLAETYDKLGAEHLSSVCYNTAIYLGAQKTTELKYAHNFSKQWRGFIFYRKMYSWFSRKPVNKEIYLQKTSIEAEFSPDLYTRYKIVADSINLKYKKNTVLDVGGGTGFLSRFIPTQKYILADINTNGISAIPLPFKTNSIDIVCSIDTLEHIKRNAREKFISELIRVAKKEIHIVVPTKLPQELPDYAEFFYKITGSIHTKEHIKFGVPTLEELKQFLLTYENKYFCEIRPAISLMIIPLLLNNALISEKHKHKLQEINEYFNKYFYDKIKNTDLPLEYYIKIKKS